MAAARALNLAERERAHDETDRERDLRLAARIAAGDEESFLELYALYRLRIYAFAFRRLRDRTEAEDAVQDAFLEVHRCCGSYEGRSSLLTWMFGIAHNQISRHARRAVAAKMSLERSGAALRRSEDTPADRRVDAGRALETCAHALEQDVSPAQREIFDLYYGANHPTKAIAEKLGKSQAAVRMGLVRTRRAMKERLQMTDRGIV